MEVTGETRLLTTWMRPSLAHPRAKASSPSGWARRAMAAGLMKKGAELGQPRMERRVLTSATLRITRGRSMILLYMFEFQ